MSERERESCNVRRMPKDEAERRMMFENDGVMFRAKVFIGNVDNTIYMCRVLSIFWQNNVAHVTYSAIWIQFNLSTQVSFIRICMLHEMQQAMRIRRGKLL